MAAPKRCRAWRQGVPPARRVVPKDRGPNSTAKKARHFIAPRVPCPRPRMRRSTRRHGSLPRLRFGFAEPLVRAAIYRRLRVGSWSRRDLSGRSKLRAVGRRDLGSANLLMDDCTFLIKTFLRPQCAHRLIEIGPSDRAKNFGYQYFWSSERLRSDWEDVRKRCIDIGTSGFLPYRIPSLTRWWRPEGFVDGAADGRSTASSILDGCGAFGPLESNCRCGSEANVTHVRRHVRLVTETDVRSTSARL